jgi:hypothetical protein
MTSAHTPLAQRTQSFAFDLPAPVPEATPLFGPVREREWTPDWAPSFLHPSEPAQRAGAVFTTTGDLGTRLWVLTTYDPSAGRLAYVVHTPGSLITEIDISVVPLGDSASRVTVTYRRSALTERGNAQVEALTSEWSADQAREWSAAITAALQRGLQVRSGGGGHE